MIKDTAVNREFAFWNDSLCQSATEITSALIIGEGPQIYCEDKKVKKIIDNFNKKINVNGKTIEDWMRSVWYDEINHHIGSNWRVAVDPKKYENRIDIARIDPKTLVKKRDPKEGWIALIQRIADYKSYRSEAQFYRNVAEDSLLIQTGYARKDIVIPDKPNVILRTSYFIKAPIASLLHFITGKRWTMFFMRKYAQKHWAPFIIAYVGDPNTNWYPDDPEEMQETIDMINEKIPKMTNWGGMAVPGIIQLKTLETGSSKSAQIYRDAIQIYDEQIMLGLYSSMSLRQASGSELSTQRNLLEDHYAFLEAIRRKFIVTLKRLYVGALLPAWGYANYDGDKIGIEFSGLKKKGYLEIAQAIERLNNTGIFKDDNEARKAASIIFGWLKDLPKGENKKRGQNMLKLGGGGLFSGSGMGSQRNPQSVRSTVEKAETDIGERILQHISEENEGSI